MRGLTPLLGACCLALLATLPVGCVGAATKSVASITFYTSESAFEAAAPTLLLEDFEEGNVGAGQIKVGSDPLDEATDDDYWDPGDIQRRLSIASSSGNGIHVIGANTYGNGTRVVGAAGFGDSLSLGFADGYTLAVGFHLYIDVLPQNVTVNVYGAGATLLGSTTASSDVAGVFVGVVSSAAIERIDLVGQDVHEMLVDDVRFGPIVDADLTLRQTGPANPAGTLVYTLTVENHGPANATGVVVTDPLPAQVSYVSDDCGGVNGSPWTWTIGALASGASIVCHVTTGIVTTGFAFTNVASVDADQPDPNPADNSDGFWAAPGLSAYFLTLASFNAAAGPTQFEDFQEGKVDDGASVACVPQIDVNTSNNCFNRGDIAPHLTIGSLDLFVPVIRGANSIGNPTVVAGSPGSSLSVVFDGGFVRSVAMDIIASVPATDVDVTLFGAGDVVIGKATINASPPGTFLGFTAEQSIEYVTLTLAEGASVYIDNVRFGPPIDADLAAGLSGVEDPGGTLTYTVAALNGGPLAATGIAVEAALPPEVSYVSDDCGGVNGATWTWSAGGAASGSKKVCHIVTQVLTPRTTTATVTVAANEADPFAFNDSKTLVLPVTGPGPDVFQPGFALFRSFYDLVAPDQSGTLFALHDHRDQVALVQVCTQWCVPCQQWSVLTSQIKTKVDQQIGTGNFLALDLIVQNSATNPSTQTTATQWKNATGFPGPVLHAQGSKTSPLYTMFTDLQAQYTQPPGAIFSFPNFFILAPQCDGQVAVRATRGIVQLNEERQFASADTDALADEVANEVVRVWRDGSCVKPLLDRIDRCSAGSAPLRSFGDASAVEPAEFFSVPGGGRFDVGAVTAVTDAQMVDVTIYADSGGFPGNAVCTAPGQVATVGPGPKVRRFGMSPNCSLGPGDYWLGLRTLDPANTWHGGIVPRDVSYVVRDTQNHLGTGCTDWGPAEACVPGEETTELCFMLEPDVLFGNGFEAPP